MLKQNRKTGIEHLLVTFTEILTEHCTKFIPCDWLHTDMISCRVQSSTKSMVFEAQTFDSTFSREPSCITFARHSWFQLRVHPLGKVPHVRTATYPWGTMTTEPSVAIVLVFLIALSWTTNKSLKQCPLMAMTSADLVWSTLLFESK